MQDAAIDKGTIGNQMETYFPSPSHKGKNEKQKNQRTNGIVAQIINNFNPLSLLFLCYGKQPPRIYLLLHCGFQRHDLQLLRLSSFICPFFRTVFQQDPQVFCKKLCYSFQFGKCFPWLFQNSKNIRICPAKHSVFRLLIQIPVMKDLYVFHLRLHSQFSQTDIIFTEYGVPVRRHEQHVCQSKRHYPQHIPSDKRKIQHKTFPFMTIHHSSGQGDGFPGCDIRIFRHDIRHEEIGIMLDHTSHNRKRPQEPQDPFHKQDPGCPAPAFHTQKKQKALERHLFISTAFQKDPRRHHAEQILNKKPEDKYHRQTGQHHTPLAGCL